MDGISILLLTSTAALLFTSTAQFCLSEQGIEQRLLPSQPFKKYLWSDLRKISVICQRGGRWGWDLKYALTMNDGHTIDIADALPAREGLVAFDRRLVNVPFSFQANVREGCPPYYADWVGEKP